MSAGVEVFLYVYDLSYGLASALSPTLLGKPVDGIWHTSVVVYGKEIFYGSHGITHCDPGRTALGEPRQKVSMGLTSVTEDELFSYLKLLSVSTFRGNEYRLFDHNCNTFSNHITNYLTGRGIPNHILQLPAEVESTSIGSLLKPALNSLSVGLNRSSEEDRAVQFKHSVETVRREFRPILFDEPLSSLFVPHQLSLLWPADGNHVDLATYATVMSESVTGSGELQITGPEMFQLLNLSLLETADQCRLALDLFRIAIARNPDILGSLLTDPNQHLHRLAEAPLPTTEFSMILELEVCRSKLLCNVLGHSYLWVLDEDSELILDTKPMVHISLLLLGHDEHNSSGTIMGHPQRTPAMLQVGLSLAHNIALYPNLSCEDAMEMGAYLIFLATSGAEAYRQPIEAVYLIRTIYFLVIRDQTIADLARASNLPVVLKAALDEINPQNTGSVREITPYHLMLKLLDDFLSKPGGK